MKQPKDPKVSRRQKAEKKQEKREKTDKMEETKNQETWRHPGQGKREKMAQERQKGHVERESQARVETAGSEKGKMSNKQGERVTNNQFTKRTKETMLMHKIESETQRRNEQENHGNR